MHAWVKRLVNTQTRLSTLFKVSTVDFAEAHMTKTILAEIKSIRNIKKKVTLSQSMLPLFKGAVRVLLEYPLSIFLNQLRLSNNYRGAIVDPLTMSGTIVHRTTQSGHVVIFDPPSCACGFFGSMGLPCRHYLCLAAGLFQDSLPLTAFHRRWTLETFTAEPAFVVHESDAEQTVEDRTDLPQNRYNARVQKFKEVNRLFGDRLECWLDVCLCGSLINEFPLPVLASTSSEINDLLPPKAGKVNVTGAVRNCPRRVTRQ